MLALQGYGSGSDEEDGKEVEHKNDIENETGKEVEQKSVIENETIAPVTSILSKNSIVESGLQICAAPDVVPMV